MAQLNSDLIAVAAFTVLNKHGVAGFTMRGVAKALKVSPMALYSHVPDKAGLAALVVNNVLRQRPVPSPTGVWQEDLWRIAHWARERRIAHPALAELQRTFRIWTREMYHQAEVWVSLWQQSGLDLDRAVRAASTSSSMISGLVEQELMQSEWEPADDAVLALMPNARLMLAADHNLAKNFEEGVRSVIEGLYARMSREQQKRKGARVITRRPQRA